MQEELKALAVSVLVDEDMGRHNAERLAPDFTCVNQLFKHSCSYIDRTRFLKMGEAVGLDMKRRPWGK